MIAIYSKYTHTHTLYTYAIHHICKLYVFNNNNNNKHLIITVKYYKTDKVKNVWQSSSGLRHSATDPRDQIYLFDFILLVECLPTVSRVWVTFTSVICCGRCSKRAKVTELSNKKCQMGKSWLHGFGHRVPKSV